ncbi:MAG: TonB family protein [Calditrichia bacterium]
MAGLIYFKKPGVDLKRKYRRILEISLILSLFLLTLIFYSFQRFENPEGKINPKIDIEIETIDIPPTKIEKKIPPPARPVIPVASEKEDYPLELTIPANTEIFIPIDIIELPKPPAEPDTIPFVELSEKPELIKRVPPVYPDLARKAGIEGMVITKVLINTEGEIEDVQILKSATMLDDAAVTAAYQFKFTPGKQRDRLVKVWMTIPFSFKLKK